MKTASTRQAKKNIITANQLMPTDKKSLQQKSRNVKNPLAIFWIEDCGKDLC